MKLKLLHKLFIVNASVILTLVIVMQAVSYFSNKSFMNDFIARADSQKLSQLAIRLSEYYAKHQTWDELIHNKHKWQSLVEMSFKTDVFRLARNKEGAEDVDDRVKPSKPFNFDMQFMLRNPEKNKYGSPPFKRYLEFLNETFIERLALLDVNEITIVSATYDSQEMLSKPIMLEQNVIGWLTIKEVNDNNSRSTDRHLQMRLLFSLGIAVLGIIISMVFSYFLSRHITAPIRKLNEGASELAKRNFQSKISVNTKDELHDLANSFNQISTALLSYETKQQQWLIDISHELRTPLTILYGEMQAIKDGVISCDKDSVLSLQEEVNLLIRLVDDLHELSLTESTEFQCKKENVELKQLITTQLKKYSNKLHDRKITVHNEMPEGEFYTLGDHDRLAQVINNILENNYRYTEPAGQIRVGLNQDTKWLNICVEDSGPGVPDSTLDKLFDRLFRADPSRNRKSGGAGIGLAICQNIIRAHQGEIKAQKARNGGLAVFIKLPVINP
ncbi:ATP-binding protein [Paraglaciecola aquimarina]|uniref:histidine kinase n=1 Tax=Paraglaciecola algarum TaxID=3050085 RepID=A0ABS9D456_9ALTE|nr:ATP-binding protein [Paraglaciecola sp. G1-23]MCF2947716.1 ATP-binding protein [Paraglaciecola sp. G1-23]